MSGKRSFVWQHFTKISSDSAKCSICERVLCSTATSGIIKHLKTHGIEDPSPAAKKEGSETSVPTVSGVKRSWVWNYFTRTTTSSADCGICGKSIESKNFSTSGMRKHLQVHQLTESCEENEIETEEDEEDQEDESEAYSSSKDSPRSWVWGFFKKCGTSTAKCGACDRVIACKNSSTTGMINHLKIHKITAESDIERIFQSDEENETFVEDTERQVPGYTKSWVWKYFTKVTTDSTKCSFCEKLITCKNSGTSGMINHLKLHDVEENSRKEGETNAKPEKRRIEVKQIQIKNDWVWKYFQKIDDTSAKCQFCSKEVAWLNSSTSGLLVHLKAHGVTIDSQPRHDDDGETEPKQRKTYVHRDANLKSWVWEYFTKVSFNSSKCGICGRLIACTNSSTKGMINHLKWHKIEPETRKEGADSSKSSDASESQEDLHGDVQLVDIVSSQASVAVKNEDDTCFICNTVLGSLRNQLTKLLGFTDTPLYEVLESFTGTELSDEAMACLAICQECFITIEQYDEYQLKSQEIQHKISGIYQQTHGEQVFIKQEPLFEPVSVDFKCQKCQRSFTTLKEMTRHNHTSCQALNSNAVSKSFEQETNKQGVQYDLDVFQRAFFSKNELQASKPGKPAVTIQKVQEKESDEVTPEFKKLVEEQGIDYNIETFRKAFGFSEQETASIRKPVAERQPAVTRKTKVINEDFAESLKAHGIDYNLDTFQKAFGFSDNTEADVKERFELEKDNDVQVLRKTGFLQCDDCPFKSANRLAFYKHIRVHVPVDKNLKCDACEKTFKNDTLEVHKVIDHSSTDGPYECPICHKFSPYKNSFRSHYNIHKLERNLLCMKCGATFAHKRSFTTHMMIHDDVRPFPCEYEGCTKSFRTAVKQKAHHRVHTGEKIFECPHCPGKMFAQAWGRELHLKKHHQKKSLPGATCNICGLKFVAFSKLKQHQANTHQVIDPSQKFDNFTDS